MENESFVRTMRFMLQEEDYYKVRIEHLKNVNDAYECFENIMYSFEMNCGFLDAVPMEKRAKCVEDIMRWFVVFSLQKNRTQYHPPSKANKVKQSDIKIIKTFEDLVIRKIQSKVNLHEENLPLFEENPILIELLKITQSLKNDLQNNEFNIFMKALYYKENSKTHEELRSILKKIIKDFNIKNYTKGLDEFFKNFKTP